MNAAAPARQSLKEPDREPTLIADLLARPRSFPLLQATRLLQAAGAGVRFRPALHLAFPAAEVESIREIAPGPPRVFEITTPVLGLYGPGSPLPTFVTEFLLDQDDQGRARDLIDLFNHRLLALFHEAAAKYRPMADAATGDRCRRLIAELLGTGREDDNADEADADDDDLLRYAGILGRQPRSAMGLQCVLSDRFAPIPVLVQQCVPRWTSLPAGPGARLGTSRLGVDSVAGDRVWSCATSFRVTVGPLAGVDVDGFMPGGAHGRDLASLVARFNHQGLDWDLELIVASASLPPAALGVSARLGWTTRLDGAAAEYRITCQPARPAA